MGKCGDLGDPSFDHTWDEGIDSCKCNKLAAMNVTEYSISYITCFDMVYMCPPEVFLCV